MLELNAKTTALVVIDLQEGILPFAGGPHTADEVVNRAGKLAAKFRASGQPVFLVRVGWSADYAEALKQPVDVPSPAKVLPENWWQHPAALGATDSDIEIIKQTSEKTVLAGARLASGAITFEQVGPELPAKVVELSYQKAKATKGEVKGNIPILDIQYGNVWSNISDELLNQAGIKLNDTLCVTISEGSQQKYAGKMPYVASFGDVPEGQPMVYLNSLLNVSVALNMDNFAQKHQVTSGADWNIDVKKCAK